MNYPRLIDLDHFEILYFFNLRLSLLNLVVHV